jgi:hypothetical protein
MEQQIILHKRSEVSGKIPTPNDIEYGEIAVNYASDTESLFFKNSSNEIVTIKDKKYIDNAVQKLMTNTELKFYCIEPVTVSINGEETIYDTNTLVDIFLKTEDELTITTTSDNSILSLYAWPGALGTYYNWLEGVKVFDGILFDMNDADMYTKWNQGNQGLYGVQFAQYKNCVFWSDNTYISDVSLRTNYTLYNSSELPLCYSTIPDNTFKAFYFAYNVTSDPNWANKAYKDSFAKATWATQVFSYYGLHSIGLFDMDSTRFNITLPKDCRGLMFYAPNILNAGVFDAINCTNFGAKSGSWRDAFAYCYSLKNLYIKNLMVNLNVSWSPISQEALNFILSEAANTKKITISLSPHTYHSLTEANKTLAAEKNIVLELITTNSGEDTRLNMLQKTGDGNSFLANDGTYKAITMPVNLSDLNNDIGIITNIPDDYVTDEELNSKVETSVANLIDSAPETLNTIGKLATALENNSDVVTILNDAITNKSDVGHVHNEIYYTKSEVDSMLSNYVSLDVVEQMIQEAINNFSGNTTPETPVEPEIPEEPETTDSIGEIGENNVININEELLSSGTYTLKYIDNYDNVIDDFKPISEFTI